MSEEQNKSPIEQAADLMSMASLRMAKARDARKAAALGARSSHVTIQNSTRYGELEMCDLDAALSHGLIKIAEKFEEDALYCSRQAAELIANGAMQAPQMPAASESSAQSA